MFVLSTSTLLLIAVPLETVRMILLCRDIRDIARRKGEPPTKWMVGTVLIWILIELLALLLWNIYAGGQIMLAGLLIGILVAGVAYFFYKRLLLQKPDRDFDGMIDQIGKDSKEKPDS